MKYNHLFDQIACFKNLQNAGRKAMRSKKNNVEAIRLYFHLETELLELEKELLNETYEPQAYYHFQIYEPKKRDICAAPVRDCIVHHAICNIVEPLMDKSFIKDSYACRKNKGVYAAVFRAQNFSRKFKYVMKCDIKKYFETMNHDVLKQMILDKYSDGRLNRLLFKIIDHPFPNSLKGKGVPIGNLTSQLFANFYLNRMDHYLKDYLGIKGYLRYMDDFLIFSNQKDHIKRWLFSLQTMVSNQLKLELKKELQHWFPVYQGIPFLGFRIFPGIIRLQRKTIIRFRKNIRKKEKQFIEGKITENQLTASVQSMVAHISWGNT
ncbi:RNA-directed DNA polymerase (reverse transcriptase), partial [Candidatus Magnetomorum sp. HK-1]